MERELRNNLTLLRQRNANHSSGERLSGPVYVTPFRDFDQQTIVIHNDHLPDDPTLVLTDRMDPIYGHQRERVLNYSEEGFEPESKSIENEQEDSVLEQLSCIIRADNDGSDVNMSMGNDPSMESRVTETESGGEPEPIITPLKPKMSREVPSSSCSARLMHSSYHSSTITPSRVTAPRSVSPTQSKNESEFGRRLLSTLGVDDRDAEPGGSLDELARPMTIVTTTAAHSTPAVKYPPSDTSHASDPKETSDFVTLSNKHMVLGDEWKEAYSADNGKKYYYNRRTRESAWRLPKDVIRVKVSEGMYRTFAPPSATKENGGASAEPAAVGSAFKSSARVPMDTPCKTPSRDPLASTTTNSCSRYGGIPAHPNSSARKLATEKAVQDALVATCQVLFPSTGSVGHGTRSPSPLKPLSMGSAAGGSSSSMSLLPASDEEGDSFTSASLKDYRQLLTRDRAGRKHRDRLRGGNLDILQEHDGDAMEEHPPLADPGGSVKRQPRYQGGDGDDCGDDPHELITISSADVKMTESIDENTNRLIKYATCGPETNDSSLVGGGWEEEEDDDEAGAEEDYDQGEDDENSMELSHSTGRVGGRKSSSQGFPVKTPAVRTEVAAMSTATRTEVRPYAAVTTPMETPMIAHGIAVEGAPPTGLLRGVQDHDMRRQLFQEDAIATAKTSVFCPFCAHAMTVEEITPHLETQCEYAVIHRKERVLEILCAIEQGLLRAGLLEPSSVPSAAYRESGKRGVSTPLSHEKLVQLKAKRAAHGSASSPTAVRKASCTFPCVLCDYDGCKSKEELRQHMHLCLGTGDSAAPPRSGTKSRRKPQAPQKQQPLASKTLTTATAATATKAWR